MLFIIFKALVCLFLIFLSSNISDVGGNSIIELEKTTTSDASGLNAKSTEEIAYEASVAVANAGI